MNKKLVAFAATSFLLSVIILQNIYQNHFSIKKESIVFFTWANLIDSEIYTMFEEEYGISIVEETYPSNEVMYSKILAGSGVYDVIMPSDYMLPVLERSQLLAKFSLATITNTMHLEKSPLVKLNINDGKLFSVPFLFATTGIAYHKKFISDVTSWSYLFDSKQVKNYKGRISMLDDPREVIGAALKYKNHSVNSESLELVEDAKRILLKQKSFVGRYDSENYKELLASGDLWLSQSSSDSIARLQMTQPQIGFAIPNEGSILSIENLAITARSKKKAIAEKFVNFLLRPDISARIAQKAKIGTLNASARALLPAEVRQNPIIYPPADVLSRLETIRDVGPMVHQYDKVWLSLKINGFISFAEF